MRWKKLAVGLATTVLIAVPSAILIYLAAKPHPPQPTTRFLLNFKNETATNSGATPSQLAANNEDEQYIQKLTKEVREVLAAYKAQNPSFKQLNLHFITLNSALTPGQLNYFNELNKTLLAISPMLGFTLQQPNPITLQEGYYQMNTDMVSLYWSPNYRGLGTWLAYVFSNGFAISNMWHPLAQLMQDYVNATGANLSSPTAPATLDPSKEASWSQNWKYTVADANKNTENQNWIWSLANFLYTNDIQVPYVNQNTGQTTEVPVISGTPGNYTVVSPANILQDSQKYDAVSTNVYTPIQTAISSWVSRHNDTGGTLNPNAGNMPGYSPWIYKSFTGGINGYKPSMTTQLVNFMCSYLPNMPYIQNGYNTITNELVRYGDHAVMNAYTNFRDWYYDPSENSSSFFKWWNQNNPFSGTITPYNPAFTEMTGGAMLDSTTFSNLFSYANLGDYYTKGVTPYQSNYKLVLDSEDTTIPATEAEDLINNDFKGTIPTIDVDGQQIPLGGATSNGGGYINFPIIPTPWTNTSGQTTGHYLSPVDFLDGFEAYQDSDNVGLNSNGYFMQLASINYNKTISYAGNQAVNSADTDKVFRIYFNKPALAGKNIIGILSNQFFAPLPHFEQSVQNIVNPALFNKIAVMSDGMLNTTATNMGEFYGCGNYKTAWENLYYTSPYYISTVNPQQVVGKYNSPFYKIHTATYIPPGSTSVPSWEKTAAWNEDPANYITFLPNPSSPMAPVAKMSNGQPFRHFATIAMNYAGGYQNLITYEMFGKNELDMSNIPESDLDQAFADYPKSIYQPLNNEITQSNLIPYNTNVYVTDAAGNIALFNANKDPAPSAAYAHIGEDLNGNYFWPHYTDINGKVTYYDYDQYEQLVQSNSPLLKEMQVYSPILKSQVSQAYNQLIVNNFYTPWAAIPADLQNPTTPAQKAALNQFLLSHSSAIIRSAINNLINWYSLCSVAFPFQSIVMQNSFMPYGVFNTNPNAILKEGENDSRWKYWSIAAYKVCENAEPAPLGYRPGGIVQWTWTQYLDQWKQMFQIQPKDSGSTAAAETKTANKIATPDEPVSSNKQNDLSAYAAPQIASPTGHKFNTQFQSEQQ